MLSSWLKETHNITLNQQQEDVMNHSDGPALVLAVAGAGKTTCLCARIAKLILDGKTDPKRICTVTFSKSASRDMKTRFNHLFHRMVPSGHDIHFSTIHSFCYYILRNHYGKNQIPFQFMEKGNTKIDKHTLLRKIYAHFYKVPIDVDTQEELERLISFSKNSLLNKEEIKNLDTGIKKFPIIFQAYEHYKYKHSLLDFDDMLTKTYYLLKQNNQYLYLFRNQFDYWQVDEFQDTSPVQWEIIKMIVGDRKNILCVGDDDQTIYSFRGSNPAIMLGFKNDYPRALEYFMEENFRCGSLNTQISSLFIQKNITRYHKKIETQNPERKGIEFILYSDERKQLNKTIDTIVDITENQPQASIGILFRKNISSIPFIDALSDLNLSFKVRDRAVKVMSHWVVHDMLNIIDFAYYPDKQEILEKIFYRMNGYISRQQLEYALRNKQPGQHILKVLAANPALEEYQINQLNQLIGELEKLKFKKGPSIIKQILYSIGYMNFLERNHSISKNSSRHLLSVLDYIMRNITSPLEWSCRVKEMKEKISMAQEVRNTKLSLTTIHASKGLEYDYVFIVDVAEGIFPSIKAGKEMTEEHILEQTEEERRLMYVAMTRGVHKVTISAPKKMMNRQQTESLFWHELQPLLPCSNILTYGVKEALGKGCFRSNGISSALNPGVEVEHMKFGKGIVASKDHGCVVVNFGNQIKKISLDYVDKVLKKKEAH